MPGVLYIHLYAPERPFMHLTLFCSPNGTRLSAWCHITGPKKLSNSRRLWTWSSGFKSAIPRMGSYQLSVAVLFCVFPCSSQLAGQHPGSWHFFILMHCPYRLLCGPYSFCPGRSCSAASWWHFQLLICSKYTEPTVMTEIIAWHARAGLGLHVNSSLTAHLWNLALNASISNKKMQRSMGLVCFARYFNWNYIVVVIIVLPKKFSTTFMYKGSQSMLKKLTTVYDGWLVYVRQIILLYTYRKLSLWSTCVGHRCHVQLQTFIHAQIL
jgi:hypothetical protein